MIDYGDILNILPASRCANNGRIDQRGKDPLLGHLGDKRGIPEKGTCGYTGHCH